MKKRIKKVINDKRFRKKMKNVSKIEYGIPNTSSKLVVVLNLVFCEIEKLNYIVKKIIISPYLFDIFNYYYDTNDYKFNPKEKIDGSIVGKIWTADIIFSQKSNGIILVSELK